MTSILKHQDVNLRANPAAMWLGNALVRIVVVGLIPSSVPSHAGSYSQSRPEGCKSIAETADGP